MAQDHLQAVYSYSNIHEILCSYGPYYSHKSATGPHPTSIQSSSHIYIPFLKDLF